MFAYFSQFIINIKKMFASDDTLLPVTCTDNNCKSADINLDEVNLVAIGRPADASKIITDVASIVAFVLLDTKV
jgi:hypothetical protein